MYYEMCSNLLKDNIDKIDMTKLKECFPNNNCSKCYQSTLRNLDLNENECFKCKEGEARAFAFTRFLLSSFETYFCN